MFIGLIALLLVATVVLSVLAYNFLGGPDKSVEGGGVVAVTCLIVSGLICWSVYSFCYMDEHWETCHVTGTDRAESGGNSYRVYTSDCDTLANKDSFFRWKWVSSNAGEQVQPGETYRFRVVGARIPWMLQYPNILEIQSDPTR